MKASAAMKASDTPKGLRAKSHATISLEAQLDKLLLARWSTARWARRISSAQDLPLRLKDCIRHLAKGSAWCAYADDHQVYFVLGRMRPTAPSGQATLEAYFLDADATPLFRGVWRFDPSAHFEPREVSGPWTLPISTPPAHTPA